MVHYIHNNHQPRLPFRADVYQPNKQRRTCELTRIQLSGRQVFEFKNSIFRAARQPTPQSSFNNESFPASAGAESSGRVAAQIQSRLVLSPENFAETERERERKLSWARAGAIRAKHSRRLLNRTNKPETADGGGPLKRQ